MNLLSTLCHQALAAVEAFYDDQQVALPERRLVSLGQSPWDCELVNVWVLRDQPVAGNPAFQAFESIRAHPGYSMRAASLAVQVVRCYPTVDDDGNPPDPTVEEEAAHVVYDDADLLWRALIAGADDRSFSQPQGLAFEGWAGLGPDGGLAGGVLTVRALLPIV